VEGFENNVVNDLLCNSSNNNISKNQKKVKEYYSKLSKKEQEKLITKFETEKIKSEILQIQYKKS